MLAAVTFPGDHHLLFNGGIIAQLGLVNAGLRGFGIISLYWAFMATMADTVMTSLTINIVLSQP